MLFDFVVVFAFSLVLEISWVLSVRLVGAQRTTQLVLAAMGMQAVAYESTRIIVGSRLGELGGILGAGLGAWFAMRRKNCCVQTPADVL